MVGFYYPSDRDLLFAHVQTSAGLLFCFMTISAGLPWHQGLWPQSLIPSSVSKFQTLAESFQYHSRSPKCCHSPFPGHLVLWVQGTSGDLVSNHKASERCSSSSSMGGESALALGQAQAAALASTRPRLSAPLGFEESLTPCPEPFPVSWSEPGFSCSACLREGCGAGRRRVGAGWAADSGGGAAELALASYAALAWLHPGNRFLGCRAHHTGATRAVGGRTCPSGAGVRSGSSSEMSEGCSSC